MGYMCHHAIIVTGYPTDRVGTVRQAAIELGCAVSDLVASGTNGYVSFLVAPDGSKEGWGRSDDGDSERAALIDLLRSGHSWVSWCEVQYGDEGGDDRMLRSSGGVGE